MKKNVGGADRILRVLAGVALLGYGLVAHSWLGAIGIIPLATALLEWCPAYLPFGFSTCKDCCK